MNTQLSPIDFSKSVSEIVRTNYHTADVFKKHGINYCCGGQLPLEEACVSKNLNYTAIKKELEKATQNISLPGIIHFNNWRIDFLIDYIVNVYHEYLLQTLPALEVSIISFVESHKKKHPALTNVLAVFQELSSQVIKHIQQEHEVIFPYIRQIESTSRRKEVYGSLFIRTMRKSLHSILANEHPQISRLLTQLKQEASDYRFPNNACTNHQVIYQQLRELHQHLEQVLHLENSILYPRAIEMEQELLLSNIQ